MPDAKKGQDRQPVDAVEEKILVPDPADKLNQLKAMLSQEQSKIEKLNKQANDLQLDIQGLDAMVNEVKAALGTYGQAVHGLEKQRKELEYFSEQKNKMVAAAIGEKKEPIDRLIYEVDHILRELEDEVAKLGKLSGDASAAYAAAAATIVEKQNVYDTLKGYQTNLEGSLTLLKSLKDQITSFDDADDIGSMYFLVLEFKHILDRTEVYHQRVLGLKLNEALTELEQTKESGRIAKAKADVLQAEYVDEQTKLDKRKASRREDLLKRIQLMHPLHQG